MAETEYRCFVGGLAWATDDHNLQAAFSQYGEILDAKIINDRETGRSRGFGFVTFGSEESMRQAIEEMNGKELDGRSITVNEAQSRRLRLLRGARTRGRPPLGPDDGRHPAAAPRLPHHHPQDHARDQERPLRVQVRPGASLLAPHERFTHS